MKKKIFDTYEMQTIAKIQTPFTEKFGVPRQPGLVKQARGVIKFLDTPDMQRALFRINEFTHLWVIFVFHATGSKSWKPSVRPPRLGGAEKVGVLASRSPHRPNPIGISVVKIEEVNLLAQGGAEIHVSGVDLLDQTPILDVKPYIPYADIITEAGSGWAAAPIQRKSVEFTQQVLEEFEKLDLALQSELRSMIVEILEIDPRPAYLQKKNSVDKSFGIAVLDFEVKYTSTKSGFLVTSVSKDKFKTKIKK